MNALTLLFLGWICTASSLMAQDGPYIRVKAGANPTKSISFREQYYYPAFKKGKIVFTNTNSSEARFNYNLLLGEMHFIDPKGDTLALASDALVQLVKIEQDSFFYDYPESYWLLLADYGTEKLVIKRRFLAIDNEKQGGYGQSSGTSSIRNLNLISNSNGSMAKLHTQGDMLLTLKSDYRLLGKNRRFYPANQSGFLSLYAKNRQLIKDYFKENNLDLKN